MLTAKRESVLGVVLLEKTEGNKHHEFCVRGWGHQKPEKGFHNIL